jgi:hypothetical protein
MMQSVFIRAAVWLLAEVSLTAIGTDDLADYGEYIFKVKDLLPSRHTALVTYVCPNGVCFPKNLATP